MSNIQDAVYTITFDNDVSLDYKCKVDLDTRQILEWEYIEHDNGFDWIDQYVTLQDGSEYDVHHVEYEYLGDEDYDYFWFE